MVESKPQLKRLLVILAIIFLGLASVGEFEEDTVQQLKGGDSPHLEIACHNHTAPGSYEDYGEPYILIEIEVKPQGVVSGGQIQVEFRSPYTPESTGRRGTSGQIKVPIRPVDYIRGEAWWHKPEKPGPMDTKHTEAIGGEIGCPTMYKDTWDYICANWWVLLIGFFAVMSYRFFSGRAMDFQDYFDEFRGKK